MNKKVYFAGSIRGGRNDALLYKKIIEYIKKTDIVLTEHIGNLNVSQYENKENKDIEIYTQDTNWLKESDLIIAECTNPSLGVGYELAYAERFNKPVYIFYDKSRTNLSAMLIGDKYFNIIPYTEEDEIYKHIDKILENYET